MSGFSIQGRYDGPGGIHVSFEEYQPEAEGAPVTPWVKIWRDHGPGEIWFSPSEWQWIRNHEHPA